MLKKIIEKMLARKIDLDIRNKAGYSALLLAIQNDRYLNAYSLVKEGKASTSLQDNEKFKNALEWLLERIRINKNYILANHRKSSRDNYSTNSFYTTSNMNSQLSCTHKPMNKTLNPAKVDSTNYKTWLNTYNNSNQYFNDES